MDRIAAVIVTYNIGERFKKSIDHLKPQVNEIIVVDNGSNNDTLSIIEGLKEDITLIKLGENRGIAYALNKGIRYALKKKYEWILTLDHDSIPADNMLKNMLETYYSINEKYRESIAMVTPIHIEENQGEYNHNAEDSWKEVLTEITSGALAKSNIYRDFRLYDEKLFIDLVDHEYCLSLNENNYKIIQVKSAILTHNLGESKVKNILGLKITPTNHNAIRRYYMMRNRLYVWRKYTKKFPNWVSNDKKRCISEIVKIIIFEDEKIMKLKMIIKGVEDYKNKKFYKFNE